MRHAIFVGFAVVVIGCGGSDAGEPLEGTIEFTVGTETVRPTVGAALRIDSTPPDQMLILIATSYARCGVDGSGDAPDWWVQTNVDSTAPGTWQTTVSLLHIAGEPEDSYNSSGEGTVVIDSIGAERVTGSITYADADTVPPASITGTFDIIRCF